jgi:hypothetical protein
MIKPLRIISSGCGRLRLRVESEFETAFPSRDDASALKPVSWCHFERRNRRQRTAYTCSCTPKAAAYTESMGTREQVRVDECCVVPFRATEAGIEFCLVTQIASNRWEFPKIALGEGQQPTRALLEQAGSSAGLAGDISAESVGNFTASRGDQCRAMTGFLMRVTTVDVDLPQTDQKRLWCLPEEARVRIRRKPLRRFIDLAVHSVARDQRHATNGNGHGNGHA